MIVKSFCGDVVVTLSNSKKDHKKCLKSSPYNYYIFSFHFKFDFLVTWAKMKTKNNVILLYFCLFCYLYLVWIKIYLF